MSEKGYARCSANETKQDINRQERELKTAGAEEIFLEYEHGDSKIKSQQSAMFDQAVAGDTVIVLKVSRLARSTQQLCEIIDLVREKHLRLVIVGSITLDCRQRSGRPHERSISPDGGCVQPVGIGYDTLPCAVRDGKCEGKRAADRATAGE